MLAMDTMTTTHQPLLTPFGAVEDCNLLGVLPTSNVTLVDTLTVLKDIWGENILEQREKLYQIVSGACSDEVFRELITEFYITYPAFSNYVDEVYLFEDQNVALVSRIIQPIRARIEDYKAAIHKHCKLYTGEFLGEHQDYVFVSFSGELRPHYDGSVEIC